MTPPVFWGYRRMTQCRHVHWIKAKVGVNAPFWTTSETLHDR
ncbi:hypothetical protein J2W83_000553 [Pseudomonas hunanensis]|uniref:Uncharacterized protein n=1 Tax=Pseudomonas hunanensis TaxID=1247546 RepID=A0ACC6JXP2_9PSED|nr:hypothetical protein [Pseudomonas sp. BP8]MDR6710963.1 hypothetical protein [Pseudomonas hunanensis]